MALFVCLKVLAFECRHYKLQMYLSLFNFYNKTFMILFGFQDNFLLSSTKNTSFFSIFRTLVAILSNCIALTINTMMNNSKHSAHLFLLSRQCESLYVSPLKMRKDLGLRYVYFIPLRKYI